jgi:hypothetical protein
LPAEPLIRPKETAKKASLAKMYQEFAKSHPDHRQFWSQSAREENLHAQWIESLGRHYHKGHIGKSGLKLNRQALKTAISPIEKQTEASRNSDLSLPNAVSIALDIEKSMIENKFFEIFDSGDAKFDRIRAGLKKETVKHRQRLENLFSQLNQTQSSNSSKIFSTAFAADIVAGLSRFQSRYFFTAAGRSMRSWAIRSAPRLRR